MERVSPLTVPQKIIESPQFLGDIYPILIHTLPDPLLYAIKKERLC